MTQFAQWLATTAPSVFLQRNNAWTIPTIQSIHIMGIAMVLGSALMIQLRIMGWAWMDRSLRRTVDRFGPWLTNSLCLLLATGVLLVIGEPVRELVTFSFWAKMFFVALATIIIVAFRRNFRREESEWEQWKTGRTPTRAVVLLMLVVWVAIIVLGRLIAYDHVWGAWSPATKA